MNNDKNKYIDISPSPSSLIESLRDIGYSMQTAVADIVDNSITARATEINLRFSWNSGNPWLGIIDNGYGMSRNELITAMRFGSISPTVERSKNDLGRFGLGLKTASFSQCRHLTVLSKKNGVITVDYDKFDGIVQIEKFDPRSYEERQIDERRPSFEFNEKKGSLPRVKINSETTLKSFIDEKRCRENNSRFQISSVDE